MKRSLPDDFVPRVVCERCRRPMRVCVCAHMPSLSTKTRVMILQHPRERDMAIGTARMASLSLPGSELHIGVTFDASSDVMRAIADPERPAALLWPGAGAIDVMTSPPSGPITLVVVDGTWSQAKKLVRMNPALAALPRYSFTPPNPSEYRIRREPKDDYVSTIEALVHVLGALEGDPDRFRALLTPFRAMIDKQIEHVNDVHDSRHSRHRHGRALDPSAPRGPRPRIPPPFVTHPERVVCVAAEANAWPYRDRTLRTEHPEELVHWVAHRPATGETFDLIVAPRTPLAPTTPSHVGVDRATLEGGAPPEELFAKWRAFLRPGDLVCTWGPYATDVFAKAGDVAAPEGTTRVDVRGVARDVTKGRVGSTSAFLENHAHLTREEIDAIRPVARGRAGLRCAYLSRVVQALADRARAVSAPSTTPNEAR
ncbi:MAG: DTW domain-containing protein [Deltaproteobacteria bacterium]|nr:DTW domain-containing protein [Deltaproteobacteria bacterium]